MKAALFLCLLALFVALLYACDPNSNNEPDCTDSANQGVNITNFWDPTRYWRCNGNVAVEVVCDPDGTNPSGFSATQLRCIPWVDWIWTPRCL